MVITSLRQTPIDLSDSLQGGLEWKLLNKMQSHVLAFISLNTWKLPPFNFTFVIPVMHFISETEDYCTLTILKPTDCATQC